MKLDRDYVANSQDSTADVARPNGRAYRKRHSGPGRGAGGSLREVEHDLESAIQSAQEALIGVRAARASGETGHRLATLLIEPRSRVKLTERFLVSVDGAMAKVRK